MKIKHRYELFEEEVLDRISEEEQALVLQPGNDWHAGLRAGLKIARNIARKHLLAEATTTLPHLLEQVRANIKHIDDLLEEFK